jgi:aspartate racemase
MLQCEEDEKYVKHNIPLIGILGGVGPMAGVSLHTKIIENTPNVVSDQDNLNIIHLSCSRYISDRTMFLLNNKNGNLKNPAICVRPLLQTFSDIAHTLNTSIVVGVCCNTFHISKIYNKFLKDIEIINSKKKNFSGYIHTLHMIDLTMKYIKYSLKINVVGLLSTTATRNLNLYQNFAKAQNISIIEIDCKFQDELHDTIFNKKDGIKVLNKSSKRVRNLYEKYINMLKKKGCKVIILGCTEIPLVFDNDETELFEIKLIDPVQILACEMINFVNKK